MKRIVYNTLKQWKTSQRRKPLLVQGARQVGKTYTITEFGRNEYENFIYLNFEQNPDLQQLFEPDLDAHTILENIKIFTGQKIVPEKTLIFFDEIQAAAKVLTSLKYFCEQTPDYHIIAAGSLLGISIGKQSSFPTGKVNFLRMYPMTFQEFLWAAGEENLAQFLTEVKITSTIAEPIHKKLLLLLKKYLFLGGMPEVLKVYFQTGDFNLARQVQTEILQGYQHDFSKYSSVQQAIKNSQVWNSIPYQLARENKKFKYKDIAPKARSVTYEQAVQWLKDAGLINLVFNLRAVKLPLAAYADYSKFKIYLLDTGLLGAMLNIDAKWILEPETMFKEFYGAFIENFVANELTASLQTPIFYWTSDGKAEVDFIVQTENKILPIEVKSGTSLRLKSLKVLMEKYPLPLGIRISPRNLWLSKDGKFLNVPLYLASRLKKIFTV